MNLNIGDLVANAPNNTQGNTLIVLCAIYDELKKMNELYTIARKTELKEKLDKELKKRKK